jgi:hypothetical protein
MKDWEERFNKQFVGKANRILGRPLQIRAFIREQIEIAFKGGRTVRGYQVGYEAGKRETAKEIIDDLETNPDNSIQWSGIPHWIEGKKAELKKKYL